MCVNGVYYIACGERASTVHITIGSMLIIETPIFTRRVQKGMSDDEYRGLQNALRENPAIGTDLGGGLYKVRWSVGNRGKSGGARAVYYWARP
jgi:hypothetical protein